MSEHDLDALDRTLEKVDRPEPPAGLTETVMKKVTLIEAGLSRWRRWRRARHSRRITNFLSQHGVGSSKTNEGRQAAVQGGGVVRTKILWGVTGVAAMALVSIFVFGYPPIRDSGTEGSIGAAQRYQGATLSMKDVKVPDSEVQQFIQSDTFDRLLKDSTARNALMAMFNNEALAAAMSNAAVQVALADPATREKLMSPALKNLFSSEQALLEALAKPGMQDLFANAAALHILMEPAMIDAFAEANIQQNLAAGKVNLALADPALKDWASNAAFKSFLEANAKVLADPAIVQVLHAPAVQNALADHAAFDALNTPAVKMVLADPAARLALGQPALWTALNANVVQVGLANHSLMSALETPAARLALGTPATRVAIAGALQGMAAAMSK